MGTAIPLDEIKRFEVTEVYSHPDAKVDIVLVHGLNGDPRKTWTSTNGTFWPTQLLPATLKSAQARVLVYGYNADVWAFGSLRSPSSDMIHQHAQTLLSNLALERKSEEQSSNPIIFVAHSLGGILVKRALEMSEQLGGKSADDLRSIFVSTYGVMFLGTPHNGADPAKWGLILQGMVNALVPKKVVDTEAQLIKTLERDNETLQNINVNFLEIVNRFKICMVHEAVKTDMKGTKGYIVDKDSAAPLLPDVVYFGIEQNHTNMCKFDSKNSPGYLAVSTTIKSWVQECLPVIQARQKFEMATRRQQKEFQADEMRGNFTTPPQQSSSTVPTPDPQSVNNSTILIKSTINIQPDDEPPPDQPYFIKPSGFRPNSLFVSRQAQMEDLHRMLFDRKKRSEGTSAVLIQSMPGGGKTHLAREYVYAHKDSFPGGIFWVRAKSCTEFTAGYWDIARHAALKHLSSESISSFGDPDQFMSIVRDWFNKRRDWLMVLDGIQFDSMLELQKYVPDSEGTALIYTSTDRSASGDHHWMNPQIIKLPLLSARRAQELLLLELGRRKPFSTEDLKNSMELVKSMGLLPVVIHAVAQRLKMTDEPLAKFARHYASEPRLRGLGTYIAVVDQLKLLAAYQALNLMYILCFFSQYIPVEMISLGLTALEQLDIPVKTSDQYTGRTLNNTFRILNMFALIERNEHDSSIHSSQSSKGSKEMLADNIDVIRLHSVVQGFFADTLHADKNPKTLPLWLDRAVQVFCCSYDMAHERITRKTNRGLVEDYRLYEIHGIRLREHVVRHEKKFPMPGTLAMLDIRLARIKGEIERRTPDSSNAIAVGKVEVVQCSIFDRSSSSSDTGPETPGDSDRGPSASSTWLDPDQGQLESPADILHQERGLNPVPHHYPPRIQDEDEDAGYDSDMDMTAIPSPQTIKPQASPASPGGNWETIQPRRRPRPPRIDLGDHRTTRNLGKQKYSDRAGSFRSPKAMDPRAIHAPIHLTRENVNGFMHNVSSRAQSRGQISGQSNAEVSLAHISQNSPPPPRGGGLIQGRSSSQRADRARLVAGTASYAAAVSGVIRDLPDRPTSEPISSNESTSTLERPPSSAREALQKFEATKQPPLPRTPVTLFTPMPPYPPTPGIEYQVRYPESDPNLYGLPGRATFSQENLRLGPDLYPSTTYPRKTGLQVEILQSPSNSSPRKRSLPHDYPEFHSQSYSSSSSPNPPFLSLSSPNIGPHGSTYYPGHPEFSQHEGGYTSQPMSRDASGQSTHSDYSHHSVRSLGGRAGERRRRPSLTKTEPEPRLPVFSPKIPPTSYQVYERMREDWHERGILRKSPRLEFSKVSERLEEWTIPTLNNTGSPDVARIDRGRTGEWNPAAPSFKPNLSFPNSPYIPAAPPNSMLSNPSYNTSPATNQAARTSPRSFISTSSPSQSQYGPYPPPPPSQKSPQSFLSYQAPTMPHTTPRSFQDAAGGEGMERSTSGGIKVGDGMGGSQVITFGDLEGVEVLQARERAERGRRERRMAERTEETRDRVERRKPSEVGLGIEVYRGLDSGRG